MHLFNKIHECSVITEEGHSFPARLRPQPCAVKTCSSRRTTQVPGVAEPHPVEAIVGEHRQLPRPRFWATEDPRGAGSTRQHLSCHSWFLRLDLGCGGFMLGGRICVYPFTHQHTHLVLYSGFSLVIYLQIVPTVYYFWYILMIFWDLPYFLSP